MRVFLIIALVIGAIACGALAVTSADRVAAEGRPTPELSTPLWSARRVPQPFVDAVGSTHLQHDLDAAVNGSDACFEVLTAAGPVATRQGNVPYLGASTQKLLTSAAALAILGPDTTFTTRAVAAADPANGTVDRLVLVGGGDPLLTTAEFRAQLAADPDYVMTPATPMEALADAIVAKGVRRVNALLVDDSRQDATRYLPMWSPSYRAEGQIGPLGALTVNKGLTSLKPPRVVDDGAIYAGNELARLLRARGVAVGGSATHGKAPDNAVEIGKVDSAPVKELVAEVVSSSDNFGAEDLMREIGVKAGRDGSTESGVSAAVAKLSELGVPMTGVTMVDGSGLARDNRVTCEALAYVVDLGARPEFASLWNGMSVAGQSGTLADELLGTGLEGKLRAKTGFLNGVTGLAGLVDVGRAIRFAFVVNGNFGEAQAIRIRGQLAQIIARFPQAPPGNDLVPAPVPPATATTTP